MEDKKIEKIIEVPIREITFPDGYVEELAGVKATKAIINKLNEVIEVVNTLVPPKK